MTVNPSSKLWIYQANRVIENHELSEINTLLTNFTQTWQAHGASLSASFEIRYNLFIILWVNEALAGASGCSIDASVKVIKQIDEKFSLDLFNRFNMAYLENGKVNTTDRASFELLLKKEIINKNTVVFNNLITTYGELDNNWEIPFANSWHSKVFTI